MVKMHAAVFVSNQVKNPRISGTLDHFRKDIKLALTLHMWKEIPNVGVANHSASTWTLCCVLRPRPGIVTDRKGFCRTFPLQGSGPSPVFQWLRIHLPPSLRPPAAAAAARRRANWTASAASGAAAAPSLPPRRPPDHLSPRPRHGDLRTELRAANVYSSIICWPWQSCQRYIQQRIWFWVGETGCENKVVQRRGILNIWFI